MTEYIFRNNYIQYRTEDISGSDSLERFLDKVKKFLTFSFFVVIATMALYVSLNFIYYQQGLRELALEAQLEAEQGQVSGITIEEIPIQTLYSK
jgi:hypothetical protein